MKQASSSKSNVTKLQTNMRANMRIFIRPVRLFGKLRDEGIHCVPGDKDGIDDAFDTADRNQHDAVYLYVEDLTLVSYIRAAERFYVSATYEEVR